MRLSSLIIFMLITLYAMCLINIQSQLFGSLPTNPTIAVADRGFWGVLRKK